MPLRERRRLVSSGIGRPEGKQSSVFHFQVLFFWRKSRSNRFRSLFVSNKIRRTSKVIPSLPPKNEIIRNVEETCFFPSVVDRRKSPDEDDERRENDPTSTTGGFVFEIRTEMDERWMATNGALPLPPLPLPNNPIWGWGRGARDCLICPRYTHKITYINISSSSI